MPCRVAPDECRERRRQPKRPFDAEQPAETPITGGLQPIDEDGFIETMFAVQISRQKITALEHLARCFGERPLIDIEKRRAAQAQQKRGQRQGEDEKGQSIQLPVAHHASWRPASVMGCRQPSLSAGNGSSYAI